MKSKIFISYSRRDLAFAQSFVAEIEKVTGIKPWVDLSGVETGEQFTDVIIRAIDGCEIFVFLISRSSLESLWTKKEVLYAKDCSKKIYPIIVDGVEPYGWFRFEFGRIDCINYSAPEQREKLLENLARLFSESCQDSAEDVFLAKARRFKSNDGVIDESERMELERLASALKIGAIERETLLEKVESEYEATSAGRGEGTAKSAGRNLINPRQSQARSLLLRYLQTWKDGLDYKGRSDRSTYWLAVGGNIALFFVVCVLDEIIGADCALIGLLAIACVFPWLALSVRRVRDAGLSPWLAALNVMPPFAYVSLFVFGCLPSKQAGGWRSGRS